MASVYTELFNPTYLMKNVILPFRDITIDVNEPFEDIIERIWKTILQKLAAADAPDMGDHSIELASSLLHVVVSIYLFKFVSDTNLVGDALRLYIFIQCPPAFAEASSHKIAHSIVPLDLPRLLPSDAIPFSKLPAAFINLGNKLTSCIDGADKEFMTTYNAVQSDKKRIDVIWSPLAEKRSKEHFEQFNDN